MADIVNLRTARKRKERTDNETKAAANRLAHGRGKAEKALGKAQNEQAIRHLDGHQLKEKKPE